MWHAHVVRACSIRNCHVGYISQYSNTSPRISEQTSIFGAVFFVSKSLFGIEDKRNLKIYNFDLKSSAPV